MKLLIKLGGSAITNKLKPLEFRENWVRNFVKFLRKFYRQGCEIIIIHGGGGFAHPLASSYGLSRGLLCNEQLIGVSLVNLSLYLLNTKIIELFVREGIPVYSVRTSDLFTIKKNYVKLINYNLINNLLSIRLVPILHGDVVYSFEKKIEILSGDEIMKIIAKHFKPDIALFLQDVDGVYSKYPPESGGYLIREITSHTISSTYQVGIDVTGGLSKKLSECLEIARNGIKTYLCAIWDLNSINEILYCREPARCTRVLG